MLFSTLLATTAPTYGSPPPGTGNPFGVMARVPGSKAKPVLQAVKTFGVNYFRPGAVTVDRWLAPQAVCEECDLLKQSGVKTILTVRNNGSNEYGFDRSPATPPKNLDTYKTTLGWILDAYRPELLVVENEENSPAFYDSGSKAGVRDSQDGAGIAEAYGAELAAACETAHGRGVKCTNGGLSSQVTALLTWENYLDQGDAPRACDFARRAFGGGKNIKEMKKLCEVTSLDGIPAQVRAKLDVGEKLIPVYRSSSIDFVNFHWQSDDPKALKEAVSFLRKATGKRVMSNQIRSGRSNASPSHVQPIMEAVVEAGLPYAIWFGDDGKSCSGLISRNGALTRDGVNFQKFIRARF